VTSLEMCGSLSFVRVCFPYNDWLGGQTAKIKIISKIKERPIHL